MRAAALVLGISLGGASGCPAAVSPAATTGAPWDTGLPWRTSDVAFRARIGKPPQPRDRGFVLDDSYKDPQIVEDLLRAYHQRYPQITALVEIGRTHQWRPIWALKISDAPERSENEPAVLFDGAHHASELLSIELVLDAVDRLVTGYPDDPRVTEWVDGMEIWCVPIVNPDGVHRFMHESGFAARRNARDNDMDGVAGPREGVDINRNYPFAWGDPGSSASMTDERYRGPSPGSEPETQAMMQLADREHFAAVLSFHTDGTDIYSAYLVEGPRDLEPDVARAIGDEIAAAAPEQPGGKHYAVRGPPRAVSGTAHDWHLHEHGAMAFVVEASHHYPSPEIRARAIEGTRPVWMALLDRVLDGPWIGGRVRDASGAPVVAEVMVAEIHTFEQESWTSRARDGRFDRAVAMPGSYTLVVRAQGKAPIERTVEVDTRRVEIKVVVP
jgi:Zinc carboxypeptidase/Carboxypeptidase regulatory-like domain